MYRVHRLLPSSIIAPLLEVSGGSSNQSRLLHPRRDRPLEKPHLRVNLHVANRIVGMVMDDLIPLNVLPILPIPVVKMHDITRLAGQRSLDWVESALRPSAVISFASRAVLKALGKLFPPLSRGEHHGVTPTNSVSVVKSIRNRLSPCRPGSSRTPIAKAMGSRVNMA